MPVESLVPGGHGLVKVRPPVLEKGVVEEVIPDHCRHISILSLVRRHILFCSKIFQNFTPPVCCSLVSLHWSRLFRWCRPPVYLTLGAPLTRAFHCSADPPVAWPTHPVSTFLKQTLPGFRWLASVTHRQLFPSGKCLRGWNILDGGETQLMLVGNKIWRTFTQSASQFFPDLYYKSWSRRIQSLLLASRDPIEPGHSASVEGQFRQISIVPKTLSLILDDIVRSYGMCLENIWLVFMHFSHFMAHWLFGGPKKAQKSPKKVTFLCTLTRRIFNAK